MSEYIFLEIFNLRCKCVALFCSLLQFRYERLNVIALYVKGVPVWSFSGVPNTYTYVERDQQAERRTPLLLVSSHKA